MRVIMSYRSGGEFGFFQLMVVFYVSLLEF